MLPASCTQGPCWTRKAQREGSRPGPSVSMGLGRGAGLQPLLGGLPLKSPTEKSCFEKLTAQCGDRAVCFNSRKTRPQSRSRRQLRQLNKQPRSRFQAPCSLASRCWRPLKAESGAVALRGDGGSLSSQLPGPQRAPLSGGQRGGAGRGGCCSRWDIQTQPPRPGSATFARDLLSTPASPWPPYVQLWNGQKHPQVS